MALDPATAADVQSNGVDLDVDVLSIGMLNTLAFYIRDARISVRTTMLIPVGLSLKFK